MTHFNFYSGLCGCNKPFCANIKLSENVDVAKGEILYYDPATFTVTPVKGTLEQVAGICAESYMAKENDLCPDHGKGIVSVILSKDALYLAAPIVVEACADDGDGCVETTMTYSDYLGTCGLDGAKLVLCEKAEGSMNTGSVGCEYNITNVDSDSGMTVYHIEHSGRITKGDKYILVLPYGFDSLGLDAEKNLCLAANGSFTVMCSTAGGYVLKLGA